VLDKAGQENQKVEITVLRRGEAQPIKLEPIIPTLTVTNKKKGIGVGLGYDEANPVIAGIEKDSAAADAGVPRGATIVSIDGQPVNDWHDVRRIAGTVSPDKPVALVVRPSGLFGHIEARKV